MIGYFLRAEKPAAERLFPLIWGNNGIATLTKNRLPKDRADKLSLILIQLHVEGPLTLGVPNAIKIGRLSKKDKSISVKVPLTEKEMLLPEGELRELLILTTGKAIDLIAASLEKRVDVDFNDLKASFLRLVHRESE
jgi:hypothetical protein